MAPYIVGRVQGGRIVPVGSPPPSPQDAAETTQIEWETNRAIRAVLAAVATLELAGRDDLARVARDIANRLER